MKKSLKLFTGILAVFGLFLFSCKKSDSGDSCKMTFQFNLQSTEDGGASPKITWNHAILNLSDLKLSLKKSGSEIWSNEFNGLWNFNLLTSLEAFWEITFPKINSFDEIDAELNLVASKTKPPFTLKGVIGLPSGDVPLEIYFNDSAILNINAQNINLKKSKYTSIINFEASKLLSNISSSDLANATKTDGKIVICSCSNPSLYAKVKTALNNSYNITIE